MKDYRLPDRKSEAKRTGDPVRSVFTAAEDIKQLGTGRKYFIRTYGCQANVRDSETIAGILEMMNFECGTGYEDSDVIIFNTCAVRHAAEEHVLGEIGNLKHFKTEHPDKIFVLCGCMSQEEGIVSQIIRSYPQIDLVFGTHDLARLPELLKKTMSGSRTIDVSSHQGNIVEQMPVERSRKYKAFVNIAYGCDKFCTYCIVPYTRGRERSRLYEYVIEEVQKFKESGGREVTLLGQNVNAYGKDLDMEDGFTKLLEGVSETGIDRIRFYSSHPRDYSITTIDAMRDRPNIMPALHLAVQSGNDEILKKMNRGYTSDDFRRLVDEMKSRVKGITFTTDLIVGFPGETDAQFEDTLALVDYCRFDNAYTFVYSPREGTPAASMEDNVPAEVKKQRLQVLNERVAKYSKMNNEECVGKVLKVLCDGPSKRNPERMCGYTESNRLVNFDAGNVREGDIADVRITAAKSFSLDGEAL